MIYRKSILNPTENIMMLKSINNDGITPHSHEFVELFYICSGKGIHSVKEKSFIVSSGDLFIICSQDEHSLQPLHRDTGIFEWVNCIFLPRFIPFDFSVFPPDCRYIGTEGFEMNYIFHSMMQEYIEKKPGYIDILRGYLSIVLTKLARMVQEADTSQSYVDIKKKNYLKKAVQYLHNNYKKDITLSSLASLLSVSSSYIGKIFKEQKEISPINYLIKYRVEQSCKLLLETSYPVYRIADESGFKDVKFYYTVFKRIMGISPSEFRKKY